MMRTRTSLLLVVSAATLFGCSSSSGPSPSGDPGGSGLTVAVRNNLFDPATLTVPVNSTVTWQWNSGGVEHNVTFEAGPDSGNRASGAFERTFQTAGAFAYLCTIHGAAMSGVVNVNAATGGGSSGGGSSDY